MGKILNHKVISSLKEKMAQAEEKKRELREYIKQLYEKYSRKEINYSFYIETLYRKFEGKDVLEWIEHFEDYIKDCKKKICHETRKSTVKGVFLFIVSAIILLAILTYGFNIRPDFSSFAVEGVSLGSAGNITRQNITVINNESFSEGKVESTITPDNISSQNSS